MDAVFGEEVVPCVLVDLVFELLATLLHQVDEVLVEVTEDVSHDSLFETRLQLLVVDAVKDKGCVEPQLLSVEVLGLREDRGRKVAVWLGSVQVH